jgi:xanthine dehydrogenase accessory factor
VNLWRRLTEIVAEHGAAALVGVHAVKGSAPRNAGAGMVVRPDGAFHGTIGGGQLEWQALAWARESLKDPEGPAHFVEQALGPDLGQCCGGRVTLLIERFGSRDLDALRVLAEAEAHGRFEVACRLEKGRVRRTLFTSPQGMAGNRSAWRETYGDSATPLLLFGAGHVGRALVLALAPLPFRIRWIDSRDDAFPAHIPAHVTPVFSRDPSAEVAAAPENAFLLVMTHAHALDLDITAAGLLRPFPYVGLIGSATKRARFERRLAELGVAPARIRSLVCPIGVERISGKEPAVIAAATVAQLLQVRENGAAKPFDASSLPAEASCP